MTDVEQDLQDRLTRLARHAPSRGDTAAHVLALRSRRRRGRAAQVAGAAVVGPRCGRRGVVCRGGAACCRILARPADKIV